MGQGQDVATDIQRQRGRRTVGIEVRDARGVVAGVVALKIGVDDIEASWRTWEYRIIVSDPEGIIFMTGTAQWLYRAILPLTPERLARTEQPSPEKKTVCLHPRRLRRD